jgi:hypothetical protein
VAALTMQECSAKYQAANSDTGRIVIWQQFRKHHCGADAAHSSASAAPKATVGGAHPVAALTMQECGAKYQAANSDTGRIVTWQQFRKDNCEAATAAPKVNRSMGFNPGSVFPQPRHRFKPRPTAP